MSRDFEKQKLEILEQILQWQKLSGLVVFRNMVPEVLDTDKKQVVFELTDGENSQEKVSKMADVATGTVSNWWREWHSKGFLIKKGARYQKIASIKDLKLGQNED